MTKEYLYESDLDDSEVLAALERTEARVDQLVKNAAIKFQQLQGSFNAAFSGGLAGAAVTTTAGASTATPAAVPIDISSGGEDERASAAISGIQAISDAERQRASITQDELEQIEKSEKERYAEARKLLGSLAGDEKERAIAAQNIIAGLRIAEQKRAAGVREVIAGITAEERKRAAVAKEQIAQLRLEEQKRIAKAREIGTAGTAEERKRATVARQTIATLTLEERKRANVVKQTLQDMLLGEKRRGNTARHEIAQITQEENRRAKVARQAADAANKSPGTALQAGAVARVTAAYYLLIRAIETATKAAIQFFATLLKESVVAAANIDSVGTSFEAIFAQAGAGVGTAVLRDIREESKRLGVDLTGISRRILPLVETTDQLKKIGELITSLSALDPLQGTQGALIAINEALAGDVISLRRRFEIPTAHIAQLQKTKGLVDGLVEGLSQELNVRGLGFDVLAETADITFKRVSQRFLFLKEEFGTPILDSLNEQFKTFLDFLERNDVQITAIVQSLGDLVGRVTTLLGIGINDFFDEELLASAETFFVILEDIVTTIESISNIVSAGNEAASVFDKINFAAGAFAIQLKNAGLLLAALKAGLIAVGTLAGGIGKVIKGELEFSELDDLVRQNEAFIEVQTEFNNILDNYSNIADENAGATGRAREALEARKRALEANIDAEKAAADAQLILANASRTLEEAQADLADAQAEVNQEISEATSSAAQERAEAIRDAGEKELDIERDFAEKRIDLARENAREIAKIFREHRQDLAELARDLSQDEADIIRESADKVQQVEEESAQERIDIEEDFQAELAAIKRKFDFDAEEAIRANDAVALLRIRRQMHFELNEARINRDEQIDEANEAREQELQEIRRAQQQELEEARITNQRKLEELKIALQQELEEQRIAQAQELTDLQVSKARELEEVKRSLKEQLDEINRKLAQRLRELQSSLADEVEAVEEAEAQKLRAIELANQLMAQAWAARIADAQAAAQQMIQIANDALAAVQGTFDSPDFTSGGSIGPSGGANNPPPPSSGLTDPFGNPIDNPFIKPGGKNKPGFSFNIGGSGNGSSTPFTFSPPPPPAAGGTVDNSRSASVALSMTDPSQVSPAQLRAMENLALKVVKEAVT